MPARRPASQAAAQADPHSGPHSDHGADHGAGPQTDRHLVIKAKGGLGNRILSAVTGLVYADLSGRVPVIDWRDGTYAPEGVNAYPLLFDAPAMPDPAAFDGAAAVTPATWSGRMALDPTAVIEADDPALHSGARAYRRYCADLGRIDQPEEVAVFWSYVPKMPRLARHMRRDPRFAGRRTDAVMTDYLDRWFTPNARVRTALETFFAALPRPVIGVHIRYTDMKVPLEGIERRLAAQLKARPGAAVFLATDSAVVEERLKARFENVHVTEKFLARDGGRLHIDTPGAFDKVTEAENALIDMWGLGRCDHLIYSRRSTFSITSALVGGLGPAQQQDIDRFNPQVVAKRLMQDYL